MGTDIVDSDSLVASIIDHPGRSADELLEYNQDIASREEMLHRLVPLVNAGQLHRVQSGPGRFRYYAKGAKLPDTKASRAAQPSEERPPIGSPPETRCAEPPNNPIRKDDRLTGHALGLTLVRANPGKSARELTDMPGGFRDSAYAAATLNQLMRAGKLCRTDVDGVYHWSPVAVPGEFLPKAAAPVARPVPTPLPGSGTGKPLVAAAPIEREVLDLLPTSPAPPAPPPAQVARLVAGYMLLTGVPIPDQTRATCVDTPLILALAALVIGECLVEAGEARSVRNRIAGLARRNPKLKGRKFDMRKIGGGVQVWRIA